jgi:hypothetical protein
VERAAEEGGFLHVVREGAGAGDGKPDEVAPPRAVRGRPDFVGDALDAVESGEAFHPGWDGEVEREAEFRLAPVGGAFEGQGCGFGVGRGEGAGSFACEPQEGGAGGHGAFEVAGLGAVALHKAVEDGRQDEGRHGAQGDGQEEFDEGEGFAPHGLRGARGLRCCRRG